MEPLPNTYLGQYLLQEVIGRSAGAVVYRAFQARLNRRVAIKVLRGLDPDAVSRFEREVQAIARLQHQNILPIYDFGQEGSLRYFVMRYVEGGATLADVLARGPMEPVGAMRLLCRLLDGLAYAHEQGVIHRDIKPSNILLPAPDWPLLADFGIARLAGATQFTPPGIVVGTVAYMAPEAALRRPIDGRADLYGAGVMLYEMLGGRLPFDAPTPIGLLGQHITQPPPPLSGPHSSVPPAAEAVALRAMAKAPEERYQSAAEMQAALGMAIRQIQRANAQVWLLGQLGHGGVAAAPPRSGYTTRKLGPEQPQAPTPLSAPATRRRRPPPPPVTPALRQPRPAQALVVGALLLLLIGALAWPLRGRPAAPAAATPPPVAEAPAPTQAPPPADAPAPTQPPPPAPTQAPAPTQPPPPAQAPPADAPKAPTPAPTAAVAGAASILLEDTNWTGGYARSRGTNRYGGRTATWIYGTASDFSTMRAAFEVTGQPTGEAELRVEGMDSEGPARTPISIAVNGTEIYRGPNPLPDDDFPYETGTWASETWRFDGALLRPGANEVTISNLSEGGFGGPPFFMLDYAEVAFGE